MIKPVSTCPDCGAPIYAKERPGHEIPETLFSCCCRFCKNNSAWQPYPAYPYPVQPWVPWYPYKITCGTQSNNTAAVTTWAESRDAKTAVA